MLLDFIYMLVPLSWCLVLVIKYSEEHILFY